MEPLVTTQRVLTWLWVCPDTNNPSRWKKLGQFAGGQLCLIFQLLAFSAAIKFVMKFALIEVEKSLYEFMYVASHFTTALSITQAMLSKQRITGFFTKLSKIYRTGKLKKYSVFEEKITVPSLSK